MNNSHLLHRTQGGPLLAYPLPATFSRPVEFAFSSPNSYVLGPVSHDRTVSMAVDPADALTVAVSGWTSLQDNSGVEGVWITTDGGKTFADVTGDLANATGVYADLWGPNPGLADGPTLCYSRLRAPPLTTGATGVPSVASGGRPRCCCCLSPSRTSPPTPPSSWGPSRASTPPSSRAAPPPLGPASAAAPSSLWCVASPDLAPAPSPPHSLCPPCLHQVLVGGLSYEPTSDTVVAATMGRGVFTLPKASAMVAQALQL
jgi:hypothetical protein